MKLAQKGVKVAIHYYLNERAPNDTLEEGRKRGFYCLDLQADVSRPAQIRQMFSVLTA